MRKKIYFKIIMMLFWILFLSDTDAFYMPYLLVGILSFVCFYINYTDKIILRRTDELLIKASALFFSIMVLFANYSLWSGIDYPDFAGAVFRIFYQLSLILSLSIGGYFVIQNLLSYFAVKLENCCVKTEENANKMFPLIVFLLSFAAISVWNIFILFSCRYPGFLTNDSISQIGQVMSGIYSNHHPFYHTMVIKFFVAIGLSVFNDINAAVAVYHVFQILFMAMCFSMVSLTLCEMKISRKTIFLIEAWYMFMPFHIVYSFTMWKDVMFGGFVILFIVFIFRILKKIGKYIFFNYAVLFISGIGICVFRSNGFLAFVVIFLSFVVLFGKREKLLCALLFITIVTSFIMKHYALNILGVSQPNTVEALSIPVQQIARVAVDYNDFTDRQRELLNQVVEVDTLSEVYTPWISDPVKSLVQSKGNLQYIAEHKLEFIKVYIQIGFKHPFTYIKAWVDQTKGFWNAGYAYWRWADGIVENSYGITQTINSSFLDRHLNDYLWIFSNNCFLQLFLSIGFYIWGVLFMAFVSIIRRDRVGLFSSIPILALLLTLVISTPVFAEFRYIYAVFCSQPFLAVIVFSKKA